MHLEHTHRWTSVLTLTISLGLSACGDPTAGRSQPVGRSQPPDSNDAHLATLAKGPICPSCQEVTGGETSDFGGQNGGECTDFSLSEPVTLERASALGFHIDESRALLEHEFSAPFAWRLDRSYIPGDLNVDPGIISGFTPETNVQGAITLSGTATYTHLDPARCDSAGTCQGVSGPSQCDPRAQSLNLDVNVDLRTEDDAIALTRVAASPWIYLGPISEIGMAFQIDMTGLEGTLRLERQHPGQSRGVLYGNLHARAEGGIRGSLRPTLGPVPDGAASLPSDRSVFNSLVGHWPVEDDCEPGELPVNDDSQIGRDALALFDQYYPGLAAVANQTSLSGAWQGAIPGAPPGSVELGFEVSSDATPLCTAGDRSMRLSTRARVVSSDGALDWSTEVAGLLREVESDGSASFLAFSTSSLQDIDGLRSMGLGDVDLMGGTVAQVQLSAYFGAFPDNVARSVTLQVDGVVPCANDPRCADDAPGGACEACGTPIALRSLDLTNAPTPSSRH